MVNINKYIKALLHPAGGHQGSHKAHQAGNQSTQDDLKSEIWGAEGLTISLYINNFVTSNCDIYIYKHIKNIECTYMTDHYHFRDISWQ